MILQWIYIVESTYIFSFQPHTNYYLLPQVDMLMRLNMSGSNSVEPLVVTLHGPYEPWTCSWERQTGNTCWWTYIWNAQNELYLLKDYVKESNPWTKYRKTWNFFMGKTGAVWYRKVCFLNKGEQCRETLIWSNSWELVNDSCEQDWI